MSSAYSARLDTLSPRQLPSEPIVVAVPSIDSYTSRTGIGRVLRSLQNCWGTRIRMVAGQFHAIPLPIIRNVPRAIRFPDIADIVLLPQLTGAQALQRTAGVPSVVIVHDIGIMDFPGDRDGLDWITRWTILRGAAGMKYADRIVTVSDFTRQRLLQHIPEVADRLITIHDGVSDTYLDADVSQHESISVLEKHTNRRLRRPLILYVGTEHPRKNIQTLLETFALVKGLFPDAQLLKVGRAGQERWRKKSLDAANDAGLDVDQDLILLEDIDDDLLVYAYRAADLFISASLYEGFGLPALEAMAVGTPVVVTNRGAFPEIVGPAGWVADPEPEALKNAAISAISGRDRDERLRAGKLRARTLSWAGAADRYLDVFTELIA
jgi:glycosyltransferase involved in cell wall biosynthesis